MSSHNHDQVVCRWCSTVIRQCRCMSPKTVVYSCCNKKECRVKEDNMNREDEAAEMAVRIHEAIVGTEATRVKRTYLGADLTLIKRQLLSAILLNVAAEAEAGEHDVFVLPPVWSYEQRVAFIEEVWGVIYGPDIYEVAEGDSAEVVPLSEIASYYAEVFK